MKYRTSAITLALLAYSTPFMRPALSADAPVINPPPWNAKAATT